MEAATNKTANNHQSIVSVIIPVYNGERYIAGAIGSVLGQSHQRLEIIVVDDGSTDGTAQIVRSFSSVVYAHQPNGGVAAALNKGIGLSQGGFLAFLDADDLWTENKLALQFEAFEVDPALEAVFGNVEQFRTENHGNTIEELQVNPGYTKGTMLIKRDAFLRVGLFDQKWKYGDFIDWFTRAQEAGVHMTMVPEVLLRRRIHSDNMGVREKQNTVLYANILKAALDRRRKLARAGTADKTETGQ